MKIRRIILAILLVSVLVLSSAILGCDLIPKTKVEVMMNKFPTNFESFEFRDIKAIRGEDDLESLYNDWKAEVGSMLALCGIEADDVDRYATGDGAVIFTDGFELDVVRAALTDNDFVKVDYRDVEVWKNTDWIALIDKDLVIVGTGSDVKACIDVIEYDEDSLLDNDDAADVMGKFYRGIVFQYSAEVEYPGMLVSGLSTWKSKDTLKTRLIFKFESKDAAKDAEGDIEAEYAGLEDVDVDRSGKLVDVTWKEPIP